MNWKIEFPQNQRPFKFFSRGISKLIALGLALMLGVTASFAIFTHPAPAVEEFQLKYGAANLPISFVELQTFAETGEQSNQLRSLFTLAKLTPEQVDNFQTALNYGVTVPSNLVDSFLSSSYGQLMVGALNLFIAPDSQIGTIVDGLVNGLKSAARDGKVTLVDVIVSYQGLDTISVDIEDLIALYDDMVGLGEQAIEFLKAQPEVQRLVCD